MVIAVSLVYRNQIFWFWNWTWWYPILAWPKCLWKRWAWGDWYKGISQESVCVLAILHIGCSGVGNFVQQGLYLISIFELVIEGDDSLIRGAVGVFLVQIEDDWQRTQTCCPWMYVRGHRSTGSDWGLRRTSPQGQIALWTTKSDYQESLRMHPAEGEKGI